MAKKKSSALKTNEGTQDVSGKTVSDFIPTANVNADLAKQEANVKKEAAGAAAKAAESYATPNKTITGQTYTTGGVTFDNPEEFNMANQTRQFIAGGGYAKSDKKDIENQAKFLNPEIQKASGINTFLNARENLQQQGQATLDLQEELLSLKPQASQEERYAQAGAIPLVQLSEALNKFGVAPPICGLYYTSFAIP